MPPAKSLIKRPYIRQLVYLRCPDLKDQLRQQQRDENRAGCQAKDLRRRQQTLCRRDLKGIVEAEIMGVESIRGCAKMSTDITCVTVCEHYIWIHQRFFEKGLPSTT